MKMNGFCLGRFLTSSPNCYESSKFLFLSHSPLRFLSLFRHFCTISVANCNSPEKIKLDLVNINCLDDALKLYKDMTRMRPLPSVIEFNQLLSRVVNLKEYSAAICLFKYICNLRIAVDEYTMNIAMNSCCLSNRVNFGFSILASFFKRGCVPNDITYGTSLKGLFREKRISEAQELFRKIVRERLCELNVVTYRTIINGLCKTGNTTMAIEVIRVMEKGRCKPNIHVYSMIIDSFCKNRMIDSALELFDEMSGKGITPNVVTYTALIHGYCLQGRVDEATKVFDSMVGRDIAPNVFSVNILIQGYCKNMKIDDAMHIFREVLREGFVPNVGT